MMHRRIPHSSLLLLTCSLLLHPSSSFIPRISTTPQSKKLIQCAAKRAPPAAAANNTWKQDNNQQQRRQKKNKYANFSKVKGEKDPFEKLVEESQQMQKQMNDERRGQNIRAKKEEDADADSVRERNKYEFPDTQTIDPYDPTTYGYIELGTITGAHGVKGEMKLLSVTDFAEERLCVAGQRHLRLPHRRSPREVNLVFGRKQTGDTYLISLEGIMDRDAAGKLKGSVLYARKEDEIDLESDEYFVSDLIGLNVFLSEQMNDSDLLNDVVGTVVGVILAEDISDTPGLGNDLLELMLPRLSGEKEDKLVMIPFVPQIVPDVDIANKAIYIAPPTGLLDLTYVKEEKVRIKGFLPMAK